MRYGRQRTGVDRAVAEGVGFEPTREREPPGGFQDRCLKPLGHPSKQLIAHDFRSISDANKMRFATHLLPFHARVCKRRLHDRSSVVFRAQQMAVHRERDGWRAVTEARRPPIKSAISAVPSRDLRFLRHQWLTKSNPET